MTETTEWDQWRGSWQTREPTSDELKESMARFRRATRRDSTIRAIEWVITVLAIVFPLVAMRHAANVIEATLGIGALLIVTSVASFRAWNRRAERTALGSSAREFDDAVRALRRAELKFVRFIWLVLGVEGAFAGVWWYGGLAVHHSALSPVAVGMLWIPLLLVVMTLVWSARLKSDAMRELEALAHREPAASAVDGGGP